MNIPLKVTDHPDAVGGMRWTTDELRFINHRDESYKERIESLKWEIDNIKQVEFPKRIHNVASSMLKKIRDLEKSLKDALAEVEDLQEYIKICSSQLPGDSPLLNKIKNLAGVKEQPKPCTMHVFDWDSGHCVKCGSDQWII